MLSCECGIAEKCDWFSRPVLNIDWLGLENVPDVQCRRTQGAMTSSF